MQLELGRCTLRPWQRSDVDSLVRHANNRNVWRNLRDHFPHPYTRSDARRWIRACLAQEPKMHFAVAVDGAAVGGIGFRLGEDVHRISAEIGFWLGEELWGRGIMSEAVPAVTGHGFSRFGLQRIHAAVFEWNPATMRVLERSGYTREARLRNSVLKDGRIIDQILYAKTRKE